MSKKEKTILILILLTGFFLRSFNLNWDQNQHLHPDERFLTMVGLKIKFPKALSEYFDPSVSSLNPYNNDYDFFVYGSFPLNLVKLIAEKLNLADYNSFTLIGRLTSALFETWTLALVFLITWEISKPQKEKVKIALWAMSFYAISVLPIQLAHFFAVETFLVFFNTLALYLLFRFINNQKNSYLYPVLIGVFTGLALACKITALGVMGIIIIGFGAKLIQKTNKYSFLSILLFLLFTYLFLRIGDPRIFSSANFLDPFPNPQFIDNLKQLASFNRPDSLYPPGIQWIKTKPIIFPLKNLILWGWGIPLGLIVILAVFRQLFITIPSLTRSLIKKRLSSHLINLSLTLIFILATFFHQGIQFAKAMRYFYPLYPFLAILGGIFFSRFLNEAKRKIKSSFILNTLYLMLYALILIYPLSFLSIYTHPHSRITASRWMYKNVPPGSSLANEHWDDGLPLSINDHSPRIYENNYLPLFDHDTPAKWTQINQALDKTDYLILSSNRLWGSIPQNPEIYPQTSQYYQKLFNDELGFKKVAEFTSYPCFPPIGRALFCFPNQSADESFTVYDHPKVIIFQKNS